MVYVVMSGLTTAFAAAQPKRGGVLKAGMSADPSALDPHKSTDTTTRNIFENVYDTVVAFDQDTNIVPSLAEKWENPDPTTYIFHLRKDVKFHTGDPFTAEDVVFSLGRIRNPNTGSPYAANFAAVESVTAQDLYTVVLKLKEPFAPLLNTLARTFIAMMSKKALGEGGDASKTIVGTGPFKFVEFIPGQRLRLVRNEHYWRTGLPYLDGIDFIPFPDPVAQVTALRTGAVDWIEYVPDAEVEPLKADSNLTVVGGLGTNFRAIYFNCQKPPFDNPKVRQAIAWALNRQEIVDVALFGVGGTVMKGGPLPPGHWAYIDYQKYEQNYEKAKQLLTEAGYPNGLQAEMLVNSNFAMLRTPAEVIQNQLKPIGIELTLRLDEWVSYIKAVREGNYLLTILGSSGLTDPDDYLFLQMHSKAGNNRVFWKDPHFDKLVEAGRVTLDQTKRRQIYEEAQQYLIDQVPMAYMFYSNQYEAMGKYVKGFVHWTNTSYLGFRTTWLDR
jgi:peptide/nickel transport system substrate-binding protein